MADPNDTDLSDLEVTESSKRCNALYDRMMQSQFTGAALATLDDDDLMYIAGHRAFEYHPRGLTQQELDAADGLQQKVRGNAIRAKDELDRRDRAREIEILGRSTTAVSDSAAWTKRTAIATFIAAGIAALSAILASVVAILDDPPAPVINVEPTPIEVQAPDVDVTVTVPAPPASP